jgi:hypothetical protein
VQTSALALVRGLADTRATLAAWNQRPGPVIARWVAGALAVSLLLLAAVWLVASMSEPDVSQSFYAVVGRPELGVVRHVVAQNSLVLALHGFACLAGFIAGSSLPEEARRYGGTMRWIHDKAGPLAIAFVVGAIGFSLVTQAFVLGQGAASMAWQLDIPPALLLIGLLPHALPELVALFLPLAAWMIASRRGDWHELLAATIVTMGLAAPVLVIAALVEVFVTPGLLRALYG